MSLNSVNTNVGAQVALQRLDATVFELAVTRRRVSSGLRVASTRDDAAIWSIAQKQRSDISSLNVVLGALGRGQSALETALAAGGLVSELLVQMKQKALAASEEGLSEEARAALNQDFVLLRDQITRVVESAGFNGLNPISDEAEDLEILAGIGTQTTYIPGKTKTKTKKGVTTTTTKPGETVTGPPTLTLPAEPLGLGGDNVTVTDTADLTDPAALDGLRAQLNESILNVSSALSRFGSAATAFENQQRFVGKLHDALTAGVGQLVDADLSKESARLRALQTREQLGIEALAIANRAPSLLTSLFGA